jgi:hypothetical protein
MGIYGLLLEETVLQVIIENTYHPGTAELKLPITSSLAAGFDLVCHGAYVLVRVKYPAGPSHTSLRY